MKPAKIDPSLSVEQHVRLELIKLLHVHSKDEPTLIARAEKLERYVMGTKDEIPPTS